MISTSSPRRAHGARTRRPSSSSSPSSLNGRCLAKLDPAARRRRQYEMEFLEERRMLSFPPAPLVPSSGELNNLDQANKFEAKNQLNTLDTYPIPIAIVTQHAGQAPVVAPKNPNMHSGVGIGVDVDNNPATGNGGKDVKVTVDTELFLNGVFNPHLLVQIDRLGAAPFADDFEVLISFPFSAFNSEALPGAPNLFIGYKTTGAAGPNAAGGIAPVSEQIRFVPNIQAGATHQVSLQMNTTGASNPLQFITGFFDGTNLTGIIDASAYAAWVAQPPASINLGVGVSNSAILGGAIDGQINLEWTASAKSKVVFDYLEEEAGNLSDSDFDTKVTFDQMPTDEKLTLKIDEAAKTFTLKHRANSVIDKVEILSQRNDGLKITGTLTDIPTAVDFSLGLKGTATLDVNANTLDGKIEVEKTGGFLDTADFLGYNIGYASAGFKDAPDLTAGYIPAIDGIGVQATNPGESIGAIELVIGDDANLELPPGPPANPDVLVAPWDDPSRHVFSLIDDGTHGTAAARLVHVQQATLNLDATDISEIFTLKFAEAAPLTAYIRTTEDSNLIPGHDVEVTLNIDDIPAGQSSFNMSFPNDFVYDLPDGAEIDQIHAFGHIDCTFFDVLLKDMPNKFEFHFDPDGSLAVLAQDEDGNADRIGAIAVRLWIDDEDCHDPLIPGSPLPNLLGEELREARVRLDDIPSFHATWSDGANTAINFDTDAASGSFAFLGGAQIAASTAVDLPALAPASLASAHYIRFKDQGTDSGGDPLPKQLAAGAFGIDNFSYASNDANGTYALHYKANSARVLVATFDSAFGGRYFPELDTNLTLTITSVPQTFDFVADLDPGFRYTASSAISSITLTGSIDDTDDDTANGTNINFSFVTLPSTVRFSLEAGEIKVIDGRLDLNADNAVNGSDDGVAGGVTVIDGRLDMNFDGAITSSDDDTFLGANVIDGELDMNANGAVGSGDDGAVAGLELKMNGNVDSINLSLNSDNAIFGTPYELFQAAITTVPAHTLATWAGKKILVETTDTGGNPLPLGQVSALLSTENDNTSINAKLEPFTQSGPGGARVHYSPFLKEIDDRYLDAGGSSSVKSRLNDLYNDAEVLDSGEDHIVAHVQGSTLDIASLQFTGFQKLLIDPETNGGTYEFRKPVAGVSPFFVVAGLNSTVAAIQLDNIPDLIQLKTDIDGHDITWHTEDDVFDSIGDVDVYVGPAGMAQDSDLAARFVMKDVPSDVHIFWDFGFPNGSANFDSNQEFELLFLAQDGGHRIAGAMQLEDLQAGYEVGIDIHFDVDWFGPVPTSLNLNILTAKAGIDNDVDDSSIAANNSKPGVDGFLGIYEMTNSPSNLTPGGPAHASSEYVPGFTFMMKDFREFSLTLEVGVEIIPALLSPDVDLSSTLVGDFVIDFWAGRFELATDFDGDDAPEFGFLNEKDYTDNTPIHLVPGGVDDLDFDNLFAAVYTFVGFHHFDDHFDPFA